VRDANTQKEIEALRQAMAQEMKAMKADFEQGTAVIVNFFCMFPYF
jgi:hypothetical protein